MEITLRVFRYNPEAGRIKPSFDTYILDVDPTDRILDLMEELNKERQTSFVFATHDPIINKYARQRRIIKDGKIVEE